MKKIILILMCLCVFLATACSGEKNIKDMTNKELVDFAFTKDLTLEANKELREHVIDRFKNPRETRELEIFMEAMRAQETVEKAYLAELAKKDINKMTNAEIITFAKRTRLDLRDGVALRKLIITKFEDSTVENEKELYDEAIRDENDLQKKATEYKKMKWIPQDLIVECQEDFAENRIK